MLKTELIHRIATEADQPALIALMKTSIEENMKAFLSKAKIEAAKETMGVDKTLLKDGTYFIIERLLSVRTKKIIPPDFVETVFDKLSHADKNNHPEQLQKELIRMCKENNSPISRTLRAGLLVVDEGPIGIKTVIDGAAVLEASMMEKNLNLLGLAANLAPLLGFLGTVTGMIGAFESIVHAENVSASVVAAGISQALVTTAAGLFVGIPLLAMYYFIQGKIEEHLVEISTIADEASESFALLGGKR